MKCFKKSFSRFSLQLLSFFLIVFISVVAQAADVQFSWTPNSEANLAGYKIYYGTASRNYSTSEDAGNPAPIDGQITATLTGFTAGATYYFAATAYDTDGFESDYSTEVVWAASASDPPPVVNTTPIAANAQITTNEDIEVNGNLEAVDSDGDSLTYSIVNNGSLGIALITNSSTGAFTYTPDEDKSGSDTFTFKVNDGTADSNIATITVTISCVNDIPVADIGRIATSEDLQVSGHLIARDNDGDSLTYAVVSNGSLGRVEVTDASSGHFVYTPHAEISGSDSFTFKVNDGLANSNVATVTVDIVAVNDAPVADDAALTVNEKETASDVLAGTDIDSSNLIYSIVVNGSLGSVTILDAAAGTYQYTPHAGMYGEDYFQFEVTDEEGAVSNVATIAVTIVQASESFVIELGEVNVNSNWSLVEFSEPFVDPIVVAKPASSNDKNPCVVRIRNLTASGFEIRVQNWNYLPDTHGYETVSFITLERGSHVLSDGTMIEAGSFETDKVGTFVPVIYAGDFNVAPVVAASIVSYNDGDAVDGRIRKTSITGFEYTMQEQEVNPKSHVFESVTYIAWEPSAGFAGDLVYQIGATGDVVTDAWHTLDFSEAFEGAPVLIADMQTTDGSDSANLRYNELDVNSVQLKIAEEQSKDSETAHTTENIGFMAFSQVNLIGDPDLDGLTTKDELELYDTNPWAVDSDQDGLDDGDELSYWGLNWDADFDQDGLVNLMDADADGDGYSDGVEVLRFFDPADAGSHPDAPAVEAGVVSVSSTWQRIHFTEIFINPVIVAKAVSRNDEDPAVVRIRNVDVDGFDISVQEWDYLDGIHGEESVGYLVVESGSYSLPDGTKVEAGQLSTKEVSSFAQIKFKRQFNVVPVVTASVVSMNETEAVTGRMKDISLTGFGLKLQEQEANALLHAEETVSFIAWEPSSGTINGLPFEVNRTADSVTHKSVNVDLTAGFTETPVILADMQTTDGGDTSSARIDNCLPDSCSLWIEEEQSKDSEVNHTSEVVGYMAIAGR